MGRVCKEGLLRLKEFLSPNAEIFITAVTVSLWLSTWTKWAQGQFVSGASRLSLGSVMVGMG